MKYKKLLLTLLGVAVFSGIALVPTPVLAGNELCNQLNDKIKILDCGNSDVVTFQGFQGNGLSAPTGAGLDSTLTRAKTAREFIINTVNFALTFLGVIAMVVIIYGGFMYVTAGGEEDKATKGKKSIEYAVIGILLIVASFAIVNTLLNFGGGTNTDRSGTGAGTGRGVGEDGSNIGQQVVYNLGAAEINNSLNDFVSAYKNLSIINGLMKKLKAIPAPTDRSENKNYVNQVSDFVSQIRDNSNPLSKTHQVAQKMLDEQLSPLQALSAQALASEQNGLKHDSSAESLDKFNKADGWTQGGVIIGTILTGGIFNPADYTALDSNGSKLSEAILNDLDSADYNILAASKADYDNAINALIGKGTPPETRPTGTGTIEGRLLIVWKVMGAVAEGSTVGQALQRGFISEKDMANAFSGIDPNENVATLFVDALKNLNAARALKENPDDTDTLVSAVESLNRLYIIVKDIKFTYVKINVSVKAGNAPLVVELNGLDSRDPTGQTIPNENFVWDPDGDGQDGPPSGGAGFAPVECSSNTDSSEKKTGPTITCTYNQPGTYIVRLGIASKDSTHIASGVAYLPITVSPSVARIGLKATVGSISEDLRKYEKDAKGKFSMVVDKNEFHVTTQEAKTSGITFDASTSTSGTNSDLKNFAWSFGDSSQPEEGATKNRIDGHKYTREGKFPLKIEVTDNGNRKDRKILNVVIAALAARVGVKQTISEPDTLLEFDGSLSRSDNGAITSYKWSILNKDGDDILNLQNAITIVGDAAGSVLRVRFKQPGNYKVKLEVADSSGTADTQIPVSIKSRKPRANFSVRACPLDCPDPTQPSLIELDGSMSFDPDPQDVLTYNWSFKNALGDQLEPKTGFDVFPVGSPLSGQNAKKLRVKFRSVGKFTIAMNVNDSHTDPSILQEDTKEKQVDIASTVEAKFGDSMKGVFKLNSGTATVPFEVRTINADRLEIDYGDNQSDVRTTKDSPVTLGSDGFVTFRFEHEYDKAGAFPVTIHAISESNAGENTLNKQIFISAGDNPLAAMTVMVDGHPATLPKPTEQNLTPPFETIRNKVIKFDGSESMDSKGIQGTNDLRFSWDFGDGKQSTGAVVQHSYSDVSPEDKPFVATLTITEREYDKKTSTATFPIKVMSVKPFANTLALEKKTAGDSTPLDVEVTAEGGADPDGKVTNYQFWYYDPADKEKHFAVIDTATNHAVLTVETNGEENEEHQYYFCVQLTDNENQKTECSDMFSEEELPILKVKNGPNKAPLAEFSPDRTSLKINDSVSFTSSSSDPDGKIESYIWDVDGDGFQNDTPTKLSTISHIYTKKSPSGGYRVKLKVIDDKGAAGYSKEIPIFVVTNSNPPTAEFQFKVDPNQANSNRVSFFDLSRPDTANGAKIVKWKWDFDTAVEYGCDKEPKPTSCNGDKTDDSDSTDQNPIFDYPLQGGTHQVKLKIEDNNQNTAEISKLISVIGGTAGGTNGQNPNANDLKADLKTVPPFVFETIGGIKKKVIHIPANSNGMNVSLLWGETRGNIQRYEVDKNIYCDSNDDKSRDNDTDNPDTSKGVCTIDGTIPGSSSEQDHCWTTNYNRFVKTAHPLGAGHFTTRLKVIDVNAKVDTDSVDIVFDGTIDPAKVLRNNDCDGKPAKNLFGASISEILGLRGMLLASMLLLVGMVLAVWGTASILSRGTRRDV